MWDVITTKSGTPIAFGFVRIVHGGRGDYVEFTKEQLLWSALKIPQDQQWRALSDAWKDKVYYVEWRSRDESDVMVYEQKKAVDYADYKVGMYYISPDDLEGLDGREGTNS